MNMAKEIKGQFLHMIDFTIYLPLFVVFIVFANLCYVVSCSRQNFKSLCKLLAYIVVILKKYLMYLLRMYLISFDASTLRDVSAFIFRKLEPRIYCRYWV